MAAAVNGAAGGDTKAAFARIYDALKGELLKDPAFDFTNESHQWIDRVMLPYPLSLPPPLLSFV
jgi:farnesyl diphosphate synthase